MFGNGNKRILLIIALVLILALLIAAVFVLGIFRRKEARSLTLYRVEGQGEIERAGEGTLPAQVDMPLRSGDRLRTGADGSLYVNMDGSRYVFADADTGFTLEATGSAKDGDTLLTLEQGCLMLHVMNAISVKSTFVVRTPDASVSVHGTSFRVETAKDADGASVTRLYVFDGKVELAPLRGEAQTLSRGQSATVRSGEIEAVRDDIDYESLSLESLSFLSLAAEKGKILSIPASRLQEIIAHNGGQLIVKFLVGGDVFGTQTVAYGEHAHAPKFMPGPTGDWDYDFSVPITKDTEILWAE